MLGFKLTATDEFLDTQGVTISYTLKSPVFRDDDNDGSFIFNTTIPATDKNKRICKFPVRIEAYREMTVEEPIQVYFNGLIIWEGTMIAKFARPEEIEVSIGLGRGEFNYEAKKKKLNDMVPDEVHTVGHVEQVTDSVSGIVHDMAIIDGFDDIPSKVYPEVNFAIFPLKVEDLCSSMGNAFNNAYYNTSSNINMWDMEQQRFMRPLLTGNQFLLISNIDDTETHTHHLTYLLPYNIFSPHPYNSWILKNIFKSLGYVIENNRFETDPDLMRLTVYNIQTINKLKNSNEGPWTQNVYGDPEFGNYVLTTKRYLYALEPNVDFNLADHVPDIEVKTYLRALENLLFFRFFFNYKTKTAKMMFLGDIIASNDYDDITNRVIRISERKMEHDKIAKLVQNFDSNDGNSGFIKTEEDILKFVRVNDVWYQGDLPVNPFGGYENKISYGQLQKKWFVCSSFADDFNHVSTWELFAFEHYAEKKLLAEGKEWSTDASAPACSHFVDFQPGTSFVKYAWHLATTKQALRFYNAYKTEENTCGLRFLFYRGLQKGKVETFLPEEHVRITEGRYQDARNSLDDVIQYADLAPEVIPTLSQYYNSPQSGQWTLKGSVGDFICINLLSGWNTIQFVLTQLYPILGVQRMQWLIQNYCEIFYVTPNQSTSTITKNYPLGTNDVYDGQLDKIPEANLSLKWDGQYGIYERFAKEFITWFNTIAKPVTILMQPSVEDLFTDFSMKKRINGVDYLIDEIRGEITGDKLSVAEVDAWSC